MSNIEQRLKKLEQKIDLLSEPNKPKGVPFCIILENDAKYPFCLRGSQNKENTKQ